MDKIELLKKYIDESDNIVFFGGAGVSTESGIPDFRSKDGLYNQNDVKFDGFSPEYLLSRDCLYNSPKVFYEYYRQKLDTRNIEPNITHRVLANMEEKGKLSAIITQNIDGLHQKAGSKNVLELHGTTLENYCSKCGQQYASDYIYNSKEPIPVCQCRGLIRPNVTLYGEMLPQEAFQKAREAIKNADMLIIGGTSLKVMPAAGMVNEFCGKHLIVINRELLDVKINFDRDIFFESSLGEVFSKLEGNYLK